MAASYYIEKLVLSAPKPVRITREEFRSGRRSRSIVWHAIHMEEKLDLFMRNLIDLERCLFDVALQQSLSDNQSHFSIRDDLARINQYSFNLLSAGRLYVDQSEHHYQQIAKLSELDSAALRRARNLEYDNSLSYRVAEALRNHVQHFGLPVHRGAFEATKIENSGPSKNRYSTTPYLDREELAKNRKFKKEVLAELDDRKKGYDLKLIFREYASSIGRVHNTYREFVRPILEEARLELHRFVDQFPVDEPDRSRKSIGLALTERDEGSATISDKVLLDLNPLERHDALRQKNRSMASLEARFVTTEITSDA